MGRAPRISLNLEVTEKGRRAPGWNLDADLQGERTLSELLEFTKSSLILIAEAALYDEQSRGFDKQPVTVVDGRTGKPIINVNPLGKIEFFSRQSITEIVSTIYSNIVKLSPVDTGKYKRSNFVFLNGKQVASDQASLDAWLATSPTTGPNDIIRFLNIQPYARKLERYGVTAGRKKYRTKKSSDPKGRSGTGGRILAPNGTYYLTARRAIRLFGKNAKIKFKFVPGSELGLTATFKTSSGVVGKKRSIKKPKSPRTYLYPSISIKLNAGGTF